MLHTRIVCENLRSAYNVGTIFRTADALGRGVILVGYSARPDHNGVKKTALGAEQSVPYQEFDDLNQAYTILQQSGILISAELTHDSIDISHLGEYREKLSTYEHLYLIVGNEVSGVEPSSLALSDMIIHIPMLGLKESLNVGQAAAILMREIKKL